MMNKKTPQNMIPPKILGDTMLTEFAYIPTDIKIIDKNFQLENSGLTRNELRFGQK